MGEFDRSLISNLPKSLNWFVRSLGLACNTLMKGVKFSDKPDYVLKTENFIEVFEEVIMKDKDTLEKFRLKFLKSIYDDNYTDITAKIMSEEGKVNDKFIKEGLEIVVGSSVLPVSTIYTKITEHIKKNKLRSTHPPRIILSFFAVMYHTVLKEETKETKDLISENINTMMGVIEELTRPPSPQGNSMADMFKNFNPGKMSEMFNKMGQDPRMSGEFKKAHGKVAEILKSEDPTKVMGDLFKEMTAHAAEAQEENPQLAAAMSAASASEEADEEVNLPDPGASPTEETTPGGTDGAQEEAESQD